MEQFMILLTFRNHSAFRNQMSVFCAESDPSGSMLLTCFILYSGRNPLDVCTSKKVIRTMLKYKLGQMGVGGRPWCDFVVYTKKGISVERIPFDETYWNNTLLPKLVDFYDSCVLPEIVSPVHALGLPVRDLRS